MRILNFASANVDYVYSVSHIVRPGETISAPKMEIFPGGKGLNQSVAAARAGADIYHAGFVGTDGDFLRKILLDSGVKLDHLCSADSKNGHAIIQVNDQGENCIVIYQGTNGMFTEDYIDSVLENFHAGELVMVQNEVNNLPYILKKAHEKGMRIVFNPSPFVEALKELDLSCVSYLVLNETEASGFFGTEDTQQIIAAAREQYPGMKLVLTLGSRGCIYADAEQVVTCPAFRVKAVDTTAAGDTFTGYFVAQIAAGKAVRRALKVSCAASAIAVSAMGAAPSIPVMTRVQKMLEQLEPYPVDEIRKENLCARVEAYLQENLVDASLEKAAKYLGYSSAYTGALIKNTTGMSFSALLQKKRCLAAAKLLEETELTVGQIIERVGYKNESFFRSIFKEHFAEAPLAYRKKNKKEKRL